MPGNLKSIFLRSQISQRDCERSSLWFRRYASSSQSGLQTGNEIETSISNASDTLADLELSGQSSISIEGQIKTESGFAYVFLIALLPLLLSAGLFLLFSQFLQKNWMESLYICRTELLLAQSKTGRHLDSLLNLNPSAKALRLSYQIAQAEMAAALISKNPVMITKAGAKISRIKKQQNALDKLQKTYIALSNQEMAKGLAQAIRALKQQNIKNQKTLPDFFQYTIYQIRSDPNQLAVKPDRPDIAPVYELKPQFTKAQALHVSWISEFQSNSKKRSPWFFNQHKRRDSCSATLSEKQMKFHSSLSGDKLFLKF